MWVIVLLVLFVVVMAMWGFGISRPSAAGVPAASPWLPFVAVLILGLVVFLYGSGVLATRP